MTATFRAPVGPFGGGGYVRPTWRQAILDSLPSGYRGSGAERWVDRLPMLAVLVVFAALSVPLRNTAFVDEARAVNAGRLYIAWWYGAAAPPTTGPFAGVSGSYPVVAATLDHVGGLTLGRLLSWVCVVVAICAVRGAAARTFGANRAGVFAAAVFALAPPVVLVANLATPDAPAIAAAAVAGWCAARFRGPASAVVVGLLLVLAVVLSPASAVLVPLVLVLTVAVRPDSRSAMRLLLAVAVAGVACAFVLLSEGNGLRANIGLLMATLTPNGADPVALGVAMVLDLALLVVLALCGVTAVAPSTTGASGRASGPRVAVGACCLLIAVLLPVLHVAAAASTGVDQAAAYAALGLAPPAGHGMAWLAQRLFRMIPVVVILAVALLPASARSLEKFHAWADVSDVVADLRAHPQPGRYLAEAADVLAYYAPDRSWDASDGLALQGPRAIQEAISSRRYAVVVLASTGGTAHDDLATALRLSPDYEPDPLPRPTDPTAQRWTVYRLVTVTV